MDPSSPDAALLRSLERSYERIGGTNGAIDAPALQRALGLRSEELARRMFSLFDRNGDGAIQRDEFIEAVRRLIVGDPRERLHFAFRLHDHDGDGTIDREELARMIALSLAEDGLTPRPARVER